jgi:hypothetical protein
MSSEITVISGLTVRKGSLQYVGQPQSFQADMLGKIGPAVGAIQVSTAGTDVSLSQLTMLGGWCRIRNLEVDVGTGTVTNNWVFGGPKSGGVLVPFFWLLPGEDFVLRLYPGMSVFQLKASHMTADVDISAFDQ